MTNQELFDKTIEHLVKQGVRAMRRDGNCAYRGEGGLTCAIGCHIEDIYKECFEGNSIGSLFTRLDSECDITELKERFKDNDQDLLRKLQHLHDDFYSWVNDDGTVFRPSESKITDFHHYGINTDKAMALIYG